MDRNLNDSLNTSQELGQDELRGRSSEELQRALIGMFGMLVTTEDEIKEGNAVRIINILVDREDINNYVRYSSGNSNQYGTVPSFLAFFLVRGWGTPNESPVYNRALVSLAVRLEQAGSVGPIAMANREEGPMASDELITRFVHVVRSAGNIGPIAENELAGHFAQDVEGDHMQRLLQVVRELGGEDRRQLLFGALGSAINGGRMQMVGELLREVRELGNEGRQLLLGLLECNRGLVSRFASDSTSMQGQNILLQIAGELGDEGRQLLLEALRVDGYRSFVSAASEGCVPVVHNALCTARELRDEGRMLQANNYEVFRSAAEGGHAQVLNILLQAAEELGNEGRQLLLEMFRTNDYEVLRLASENAHRRVFDLLLYRAQELELLQELRQRLPQLVGDRIEAGGQRLSASSSRDDSRGVQQQWSPQTARTSIGGRRQIPSSGDSSNADSSSNGLLNASTGSEDQSSIDEESTSAGQHNLQRGDSSISNPGPVTRSQSRRDQASQRSIAARQERIGSLSQEIQNQPSTSRLTRELIISIRPITLAPGTPILSLDADGRFRVTKVIPDQPSTSRSNNEEPQDPFVREIRDRILDCINNNDVSVLTSIMGNEERQVQLQMLRYNNFEVFRSAVTRGRREMLYFLIGITLVLRDGGRQLRFEMLRYNNYEVFRSAAQNGHVGVMDALFGAAAGNEGRELLLPMLQAGDYEILRLAARGGYREIVMHLYYSTQGLRLQPEELLQLQREMLNAALADATAGNHREVVDYISQELVRMGSDGLLNASAGSEGQSFIDEENAAARSQPEVQQSENVPSHSRSHDVDVSNPPESQNLQQGAGRYPLRNTPARAKNQPGTNLVRQRYDSGSSTGSIARHLAQASISQDNESTEQQNLWQRHDSGSSTGSVRRRLGQALISEGSKNTAAGQGQNSNDSRTRTRSRTRVVAVEQQQGQSGGSSATDSEGKVARTRRNQVNQESTVAGQRQPRASSSRRTAIEQQNVQQEDNVSERARSKTPKVTRTGQQQQGSGRDDDGVRTRSQIRRAQETQSSTEERVEIRQEQNVRPGDVLQQVQSGDNSDPQRRDSSTSSTSSVRRRLNRASVSQNNESTAAGQRQEPGNDNRVSTRTRLEPSAEVKEAKAEQYGNRSSKRG